METRGEKVREKISRERDIYIERIAHEENGVIKTIRWRGRSFLREKRAATSVKVSLHRPPRIEHTAPLLRGMKEGGEYKVRRGGLVCSRINGAH